MIKQKNEEANEMKIDNKKIGIEMLNYENDIIQEQKPDQEHSHEN